MLHTPKNDLLVNYVVYSKRYRKIIYFEYKKKKFNLFFFL